MAYSAGDRVIIHPNLENKLRSPHTGTVLTILSLNAIQVLLDGGDGKKLCCLSELSLIPPTNAEFEYGDTVKIVKNVKDFETFISGMEGKIGRIIGYEKSTKTFRVETASGSYWLAQESLAPIEFTGEIFYRAGDKVMYEGEQMTVIRVKNSDKQLGQLLYLNGDWVPSTVVKKC